MRVRNALKMIEKYSYHKMRGKFRFFDFLALRMFSKLSFPKMNIIPFVKRKYQLDSEEEFLCRYFVSRIDFHEIWASKDRTSQKNIESFYQEHDKDIWRQAYLSKYDYVYKKKILAIAHAIRSSVPAGGRILDYGGGAGVLAHFLKEKGFEVDLADIPSSTLTFTACLNLGHYYTIGRDEIPFAAYDAVVCTDVLEHTLEPLTITQRLTEYLKEDGVFYIIFPTEDDFSCSHVKVAQNERNSVFRFLDSSLEVVIPQRLYRKIAVASFDGYSTI